MTDVPHALELNGVAVCEKPSWFTQVIVVPGATSMVPGVKVALAMSMTHAEVHVKTPGEGDWHGMRGAHRYGPLIADRFEK